MERKIGTQGNSSTVSPLGDNNCQVVGGGGEAEAEYSSLENKNKKWVKDIGCVHVRKFTRYLVQVVYTNVVHLYTGQYGTFKTLGNWSYRCLWSLRVVLGIEPWVFCNQIYKQHSKYKWPQLCLHSLLIILVDLNENEDDEEAEE